MKHDLTDECTVVHNDQEGQCRWCNRCANWVPPALLDEDCRSGTHIDHIEEAKSE
jgi:hypothetical protein